MSETLSPYTPSWRESAQGLLTNALMGMGASKGYAQNFGEGAGNVLSALPGVGNALSANDAYRDYQGGNYLGAALNGAMALPLPLATPEEDAARGIIAYHGSPYSFDKFDASKIGTGEGAQAYGHGLYFAENEGVARDYRKHLAPGNSDKVKPDEIATTQYGPQWDAIVNKIHEIEAGRPVSQILGETKQYYDALDNLHAQMIRETVRRDPGLVNGRMYQVRINAQPEQFLDWDKPLSEQGQSVQQAFNWRPNTITDEQIAGAKSPLEAQFLQDQRRALESRAGQRPQNIYDLNQPEVTSNLQKAGIPGIRYLDQGSRATSGGQLLGIEQGADGMFRAKIKVSNRGGLGFMDPTDAFTTSKPYASEAEARAWANDKIGGGTHNYVVFDPSIVDILKRYGLAGMGGATVPLSILMNSPDSGQQQAQGIY